MKRLNVEAILTGVRFLNQMLPKKLTLTVIMAAAMVIAALTAPTYSYSESGKGVPGRLQELNTNVLDISEQLAEISDALGQLNSAASKGTPTQLRLRGLFQPGDIICYDPGLC